MIRIGILEHEKETKDIVFALAKVFDGMDWTFRHFYKASQLAKASQNTEFQIFIFDEMFKTPRFESVFVHDHPNAVIIYLCTDPKNVKQEDCRSRIFYLAKANLYDQVQAIAESRFGPGSTSRPLYVEL